MFTGLIETTGTIQSLQQSGGAARVVIAAPAALLTKLKTGDSIAVSGVCLTALDIGGNTFAADLAAETLARTGLPRLQAGSVVNLELPTPAGTPLGGHVVQGHVDGVGTLESLEPLDPAHPNTTDWWLRLKIPANCAPYVVEKGSITVEGISLTVARVDKDHVMIAIIPHTYAMTNLHTLKPGCAINIEADVLAKYAEQRGRTAQSEFELTVEYLIANGY